MRQADCYTGDCLPHGSSNGTSGQAPRFRHNSHPGPDLHFCRRVDRLRPNPSFTVILTAKASVSGNGRARRETPLPTILLIGEDDMLQRTRAAVLQKSGAAVVCARPGKALGLQAVGAFDLAIFCHTVSIDDYIALAKTVRERWPETKILRISQELPWGDEGTAPADAVASRQPEPLLKKTAELLQKLPN